MNPVDRRGLGEIVAWASILVSTAIVAVVAMIMHDASAAIAFGLFNGAVVALISRGTKGAIDRDALREQRDKVFYVSRESLRREEHDTPTEKGKASRDPPQR